MLKVIVILAAVNLVFAAPNQEANDGSSANQLRIVGGHPTDIINHPWQVSIQNNYTHFCGGIIFTPYLVITAAHCLLGDIKNVNIRAGSTNRDSGGQIVTIRSYVIHPDYNKIMSDSDIGMIRLNTPITHPNTRPAILPRAGEVIPLGAPLTITGWGFTKEGGVGSPILLEVTVPVVDRASCSRSYGGAITKNMFCAGLPGGGQDSCSMDSGGAATIDGVVVGVVSFGMGCARPNFPGVYVKIANFRHWIDTFRGF